MKFALAALFVATTTAQCTEAAPACEGDDMVCLKTVIKPVDGEAAEPVFGCVEKTTADT